MSSKSKKNSRLLYSKETLKEALAAIKAGMPINTASNKYHIPRSTLHNKKTAKYADKRPGPDTVLTTAEENSLVQWIFNCSKQGMPVGKQHLLNSVALLVKVLNRENPFANGRPGRHWYQSFLRRHENVVEKINENTLVARATASEIGLKSWFCKLRLNLKEKNLLDIDPSRIFSTDTVALLNPDTNENKENLYIQVAGNAAGQLAPFFVLFNYQRIPGKIYEKLPKGWFCGKSDSGCMTPENLFDYVTKCFYPWLVENNIVFPIILFLDGRVAHLTLSLSDYCLRNKIELIALYPNSSRILQPLDVAFFSPLKLAWQEALNNYRSKTKATNLLKENVAPLLKSVCDNLDNVNILISGFKTCGLFPLSENAINYDKVPKNSADKVQMNRIEFAPYIPEELLIQSQEEEPTVTSTEFLHFMEQTIDVDTLAAFKNVGESDEWTGKIENKGLFHFWRKILKLSKTETNNFNFEQNNTNEKYSTGILETDINSVLNAKQEDMELLIEDPIKICVAEIEDT